MQKYNGRKYSSPVPPKNYIVCGKNFAQKITRTALPYFVYRIVYTQTVLRSSNICKNVSMFVCYIWMLKIPRCFRLFAEVIELQRWHHTSLAKLSSLQACRKNTGTSVDLTKAGMFNVPIEKQKETWICLRHRFNLGRNCRPLKTCQFPSHSGPKKKQEKQRYCQFRNVKKYPTLTWGYSSCWLR